MTFWERHPIFAIICILFVVVVVMLGLTWIVQGSNFFMYKVFAPAQAEVERDVFENTRSFNQGMVQELENMQFEYIKEDDPNARAALADIIIHRASGYNLDEEIVPQDLRNFIEALRDGRIEQYLKGKEAGVDY